MNYKFAFKLINHKFTSNNTQVMLLPVADLLENKCVISIGKFLVHQIEVHECCKQVVPNEKRRVGNRVGVSPSKYSL